MKRFKLDNFEQIENYESICNEKILQEFEESDNISELRNMILEAKIKDINAIKRDIYFYKKYTQQENETIKLFEKLLETQDKEELLKSYQKLNEMSTEFDLDNALSDIRNTLSEISKEDVASKMNEMEEKIQNAKTRNIDGQEVIDLTGTEFNLLISVIGASGSPYLVRYYNNQIDKLRKAQNNKILFSILKRTDDMRTRLGIKRLVNKRNKIDPLRNRQRCVSSIDEDFMGHVQSEKYSEEGEKRQIEEKLILAYFPKNKTDITCMGNQDLMTIYDKDRSNPTRKRVPHRDNASRICNLKLQDLNAITIGNDNELVIDSYPGAVMCFDKVSNIAKKTANKLNIPILYIDSAQQFKIIKEKTDKYYTKMYEKILQDGQISEETFDETFNVFEQNNNIIHRAFKMAHGFGYLDDEDYPKEQIIEVFETMTNLVKESLKRCNQSQREVIQKIMLNEANIDNARYGNYSDFIDFKGLINLVLKEEESNQLEK